MPPIIQRRHNVCVNPDCCLFCSLLALYTVSPDKWILFTGPVYRMRISTPQVLEGVAGDSVPDRFGALLRGYLGYLHLMDESIEHYDGE